jgi:hypothetical protein
MPPPSPLPRHIQAYMRGAWYHGRPPTARAQPASTRHKSATQHKLIGAHVHSSTTQQKCPGAQHNISAQANKRTAQHNTSAQAHDNTAQARKRTTRHSTQHVHCLQSAQHKRTCLMHCLSTLDTPVHKGVHLQVTNNKTMVMVDAASLQCMQLTSRTSRATPSGAAADQLGFRILHHSFLRSELRHGTNPSIRCCSVADSMHGR